MSALLQEIASQAVRTLHDLDKRLLAALTPLGSAPDVPDGYGQLAYSLRMRPSTAATVLERATPEQTISYCLPCGEYPALLDVQLQVAPGEISPPLQELLALLSAIQASFVRAAAVLERRCLAPVCSR